MVPVWLPAWPLAVVAIAAIFRPTDTRCPVGTYLGEGVRLDGSFACYSQLPACCGDARPPCSDIVCPEQTIQRSRVRCTGGTEPIIVDHRTVGCQPGGWDAR